MTPAERAAAVQTFGYTPRQAAFIALVAEHSGYFVRRQWLTFAGLANGQCSVEFFGALVARGHARAVQYGRYAHVYHIASRPLYAAMREEHNRHRRQVEPSTITQKLMTLDLVLAFRDRAWYGTEREKVALFTERYGLDAAILPAKTYQALRGIPRSSVRHFVEKYPVGVGSASASPSPASPVTFTYISAGEGTAAGFETFLRAYAPLIARLPAVAVLYVSRGSDWGRAAQIAFGRRYPLVGSRRPAESIEPPRLAEHFRARQRLETGDLAHMSARDMEHLRSELARFRGPAYDRLYHAWQSTGDAVLATAQPMKSAPQSPGSTPIFEAHHLPYTYPLAPSEHRPAVANG